MQSIDNNEAWKMVPPEEKLQLMSRAHAAGTLSALIWVVILSTIALALKISGIMWCGIITAPFVFQFSAGKCWRGLRPRVLLEYLAARSAARRFAFTEGARDLQARLMFRGKLERIYERADVEEALAAVAANLKEAEVWVALFQDTVVMMNEQPGGASLAFGHQLNDKIQFKSSDDGGYSQDKEVYITAKTKTGETHNFKLTSAFPGALAVFEKKALQYQLESTNKLSADIQAIKKAALSGDDDDSQFSPMNFD